MAGLLAGLAALTIGVLRIGLFQTPSMHCPGILPVVSWILLGLLLACVALSGGALALEALRRTRGARLGELVDLQVSLAVVGPAFAALVIALLGLRPTVCM